MGEAQEVECFRLAKPRPLPLLHRAAAELDQTGLVRMQGQRKLRQPIPQFCLEPLGVGLVFKAGDDVIGIAHQDDVPPGMVASPPLSPEIEDVMQVDVRQQRRGHSLNAKGNFCLRLSWSSRRLVRSYDCPMVRWEGEWSAG